MVNLIWNTPPGPLANFVIGQSSTVAVSATDTASHRTLTYILVGGSLPPGMTITTAGVISGIPSYATPTGTYYSLQGYNFTVRALDPTSGIYVDSAFSIEVTNYTNTDTFEWVTNAGNLGTVADGDFYSKELEANDSSGLAISYSFNSGELPAGLQLVNGKTFNIINILPTNPVTIVTSDYVNFFTGQVVHFKSIVGTTELNGKKYFIKMLGAGGVATAVDVAPGTSNYFQLYNDSKFTNPVDGTNMGAYVVNGLAYTNGYLQGTPTIVNTSAIKDESFRFTIRATNAVNHVSDRSFTLTVSNKIEPIINPHGDITSKDGTTVTQPYFLTSILDGTYYSQQLYVVEKNPDAVVEWELDDGELPPGIVLSKSGMLSGYLQPVQLVGAYGPDKFDGDTTYKTAGGYDTGIITAEQEYDYGPFDFNNINQSEGYIFTVRAYDGANYVKQQYTIQVVAKNDYKADSGLPINNPYLTIDSGDVYIPVITNTTNILPSGRQDSFYAFKIDAYDFEGDALTFYIANTVGTFDAYVANADGGFDFGGTGPNGDASESNPLPIGRKGVGFDSFDVASAGVNNLPGLLLDSRTGWLYGRLNPQTSAYENYTFGVFVTKIKNGKTYNSKTTFFTLPVFGDINNTIKWESPADLGTVDNGSISELNVVAKSSLNKELIYSIYDHPNYVYGLPQGLSLLPTGEISGRVSFEVFDFDDFATTFDNSKLTVDRTYTFTVQATSTDGTVNSLKEFTIKVNLINKNPYKNLYLRAMPTFDQRQIYNSVVSDETIFNPDLIYRADDPWFGVNKNLEMLFLPGLKSEDLATFEAAMQKNHYTKTYTFGNIKTAVVLDNLYNVKYEVVYVEVLDPEENSAKQGPGLEINPAIRYPYIDATGGTHSTIYPNTTKDMASRIVSGVGYEDQNSLPEWMTSNQPDPTSPNKFKTPLGFTKAVVLAYTKPKYSNLIAYRLRNSGINFNRIQFSADRYIIDDFYSSNFSGTSGTYTTAPEATFDALPNRNIGKIDYIVDFGVTVPFDEINGRPLDYVLANGGIDGQIPHTGQKIIFVKQEAFNNKTYDGWVNYSDLYLGDNITTDAIEGYGSESYDTYSIVPGYLENAQNPDIVNKRGGVWQLNIVNGIVSLEFLHSVQLNQRIRILTGKTFTSAIVFYSVNLAPGQSVPFYEVYRYEPNTRATPTTFNGGGTRFFSYRDTYYSPGTQDKYVKFPQYGVY